ncbi:MAG: hypothetical protein IJ444_09785 [Kiritimatiellae bacterium]|nr:hypothetical protein [Kiritimatiellia bacterium]
MRYYKRSPYLCDLCQKRRSISC